MPNNSSASHNRGLSGVSWRKLLDLLSSVWLGITLMVIIFIYSSVGSAFPPVRQGYLADWLGLEFLRFEKTEMEWFNWWPFQIMIGLFCFVLVLATLRRIRFNRTNLGVWMIHTGIIILAVSSAIYFGMKVEGDVPIFHSRAMIQASGMSQPVSMVVRPEASTTIQGANDTYLVRITHIDPAYIIPSGEHEGEKTAAVDMKVSSLTGRSFTRRIFLGYPQYTQDLPADNRLGIDFLPGSVIDSDLQITLAYDPAEHFYIQHTTAVYARFSNEQEWTQFRIHDTPQYAEHISRADSIWSSSAESIPIRPLDLPGQRVEASPSMGELSLRVTDYLPYAQLQSRWIAGGEHLNPLVRFDVQYPMASLPGELRAGEVTSAQSGVGYPVAFEWVRDAAQRQQLLGFGPPGITVAIPSLEIEKHFTIAELSQSSELPIEGTDYVLSLHQIIPASRLQQQGGKGAVIVDVRNGEQRFRRLGLSGQKESWDIDANMMPLEELADSDFTLSYRGDAEQRILLVAGPDAEGIDVALAGLEGVQSPQRIAVGQAAEVVSGISVRINALIPNARQEQRPSIIPPPQRQSMQRVGRGQSLIRVEVNDGTMTQGIWLPYHDYAFRNAQWAQPGRFMHFPRKLTLSDGRQVELIYARWRQPLPTPIALDRFILKTYPGGDQPADYISWVRFLEDGQWSPIHEVKSNHPAAYGGYWFFQSMWDPQAQAHTILGVGNRVGVYWMLLGTCLSIAGMIYAFYVKPVLIRRRKQAALAEHERRKASSEPSTLSGTSEPKPEVELV